MSYTPRLEPPAQNNKYYKHISSGGVNECIFIKNGSCLPNCVGYAWGRRFEITGKRPSLAKMNAEDWYGYNADKLKRSQTPQQGAVICWSKGKVANETDGCGHVAIVELVCSNGDIVTSESAYGGEYWRLRVYTKASGYSMGSAYKFQGFILMDDTSTTTNTTSDITEIALQVIRGEWGNGEERRKRLEAAGYNYNEVQKKVEELL